jgi:hypothetical protein
MKRLLLAFGFISLILCESAAYGAHTHISSSKAWHSFKFKEGNSWVYFVTSRPEKEEGAYEKRGKTYLTITSRPDKKTSNVVNVVSGYTYKKDSVATLEIIGKAGKKTFTLFTQGEGAWAVDDKTDTTLVTAMKSGNNLIVKGTSARGTKTTDTYSLMGISSALESIKKATGGSKKAPPKAPAKKAPAKKEPPKAPAKKAPAKKAPPKAPAKKAPAKKAPPKTPAKKAPTKAPAKKSPPKKAPVVQGNK